MPTKVEIIVRQSSYVINNYKLRSRFLSLKDRNFNTGMLEQLFGSRTRWKLLKLFLSHKDEAFYIRELTRLTDEKLNSIRRELANLEDWGIIKTSLPKEKKIRRTKKTTRIQKRKENRTKIRRPKADIRPD